MRHSLDKLGCRYLVEHLPNLGFNSPERGGGERRGKEEKEGGEEEEKEEKEGERKRGRRKRRKEEETKLKRCGWRCSPGTVHSLSTQEAFGLLPRIRRRRKKGKGKIQLYKVIKELLFSKETIYLSDYFQLNMVAHACYSSPGKDEGGPLGVIGLVSCPT